MRIIGFLRFRWASASFTGTGEAQDQEKKGGKRGFVPSTHEAPRCECKSPQRPDDTTLRRSDELDKSDGRRYEGRVIVRQAKGPRSFRWISRRG